MGLPKSWADSFGLVDTEWTWLTGTGAPVAARVDRPGPDQAVVGSLVIVPPIVRERVSAFRTLRYLALAAASRGFVAVSIDLPGDGDSPRTPGLDLVADWRSAVGAAEELARFLAPGAPMHEVGLRIGACLLTDPLPGTDELRMVWQPVRGRSFVRQQRNARRVGIHVEPMAQGTEFPGGYFTDADVAAMAGLAVPTASPAVPAASPALPSAVAPASGWRIRHEADPAVGDRIAMCPPAGARIPYASIHEIVASLPRGTATGVPRWRPTASAVVSPGVVETIGRLGPHGLRSVLTAPADGATTEAAGTAGTAVAFTAMGSELSSGPGDLWPSLARQVARRGVVSLRADRRGLGEAFQPDEPDEPPCYTDEAVADTEALLAALRAAAPGARTVGVGVCAGAWCFLRAAATTPLDRILAVNPVHWSPDVALYDAAFYGQYHAALSDPLPSGDGVLSRGDRMRRAWRTGSRGAQRVWSIWSQTYRGDRIGRMTQPLGRQTRVDLLVGVSERRRFLLKGGGWHLMRGTVHATTVDDLDHSLLSERGRRAVAQHVLDSLDLVAVRRPLALAS